ncbi:transposase [Zunongwangia profunda]|uniref:transposase n=1 Tax=Zunongwangia profunda TaxID=398743 RepID=UPI00248D9AC5|nr:transposase [Zunongwangia profunda]
MEKTVQAAFYSPLDNEQRSKGNKCNGKGNKKLKSGFGSSNIETPENLLNNFQPELVKKRQTILVDNLSEKIIGLYEVGMSYRDISGHIKEMYDNAIPHMILSQITDQIIPDI